MLYKEPHLLCTHPFTALMSSSGGLSWMAASTASCVRCASASLILASSSRCLRCSLSSSLRRFLLASFSCTFRRQGLEILTGGFGQSV